MRILDDSRGAALARDAALSLLPLFARFVLAATLLAFFWRSALTKLGGEGIASLWTPSLDAYVQILPWRMEAVGYDAEALGALDRLVVVGGTWAELALPLLLAIGLFTRLAALGMLGFVAVMTLVDLFGHGVAPGAWFDGDPAAAVADQRLYWALALAVLTTLGGGALSLDRLRHRSRRRDARGAGAIPRPDGGRRRRTGADGEGIAFPGASATRARGGSGLTSWR